MENVQIAAMEPVSEAMAASNPVAVVSGAVQKAQIEAFNAGDRVQRIYGRATRTCSTSLRNK